ncbi:MAG: hypothetical protein WDA18_01320 [Candidatus Ratteibacteria bacterium]
MIQNKRIIFLVLLLMLVMLYQFLYLPSTRKLSAATALTAKKEQEYQKILSLAEEYRRQSSGDSSLQIAPSEFSLFPSLSFLLEEHFSKDRIIRITPVEETLFSTRKEESISFSLDDITLESLVGFLESLHTIPYCYFSLFQLSRNTLKPHTVRVDIQLVVYRDNANG